MKLFEALTRARFIAIMRRIPADQMLRCAELFAERGGEFLEITFDPSDSDTLRRISEALAGLKARFPLLHLGCGTVLTPAMAEAAADSGAEFIVSPTTSETVITVARNRGLAAIPGAFTPNEIERAASAGADLVKLFPILPGQEGYVKTVMSPLSHIPFIVTGGVNPETLRSMLGTGAVAVGAGASVFPPDRLEQNDWAGVAAAIDRHFKELRHG